MISLKVLWIIDINLSTLITFTLKKWEFFVEYLKGQLWVATLFMNDIIKIEYDDIILYAEDGAFCLMDISVNKLIHKVQLLANDITRWLSYNSLFQTHSKLTWCSLIIEPLHHHYQIYIFFFNLNWA